MGAGSRMSYRTCVPRSSRKHSHLPPPILLGFHGSTDHLPPQWQEKRAQLGPDGALATSHPGSDPTLRRKRHLRRFLWFARGCILWTMSSYRYMLSWKPVLGLGRRSGERSISTHFVIRPVRYGSELSSGNF
jgi:hypothetical protein